MLRLLLAFGCLVSFSKFSFAANCPEVNWASFNAGCVGTGSCGQPGVQYENYRVVGASYKYGGQNIPGQKCMAKRCGGNDELMGELYEYAPLCGGNREPRDNDDRTQRTCQRAGSIVSVENRMLGEVIPVVGTSFKLYYGSDRVIGFENPYTLKTTLTNANVYPSVTSYDVEIFDESNTSVYTQSYSNVPNQEDTYVFDGLTASGGEAWASVKYKVVVTANRATQTTNVTTLMDVGTLNAKKLGIGGWVPDIWHFYDSNAKRVYSGDGQMRVVTATTLLSGNFQVADVGGELVHEFYPDGRHYKTYTGITGSTLYEFGYDGSGRLTSITEPHSQVTSFNRKRQWCAHVDHGTNDSIDNREFHEWLSDWRN